MMEDQPQAGEPANEGQALATEEPAQVQEPSVRDDEVLPVADEAGVNQDNVH